jgi:hypothetical protein
MASVVEGNGVSNDVLEVDSARGTLKSPRAAALNDGMLAASAKLHFDSNLYVVAKVPTGPPSRLPTKTSSPLSRYTPPGVSLVVSTFVYKQP